MEALSCAVLSGYRDRFRTWKRSVAAITICGRIGDDEPGVLLELKPCRRGVMPNVYGGDSGDYDGQWVVCPTAKCGQIGDSQACLQGAVQDS